MKRLGLVALLLAALGACSKPENPPSSAAAAPPTNPPAAPKQPTVLDDQLKAIDKAKGVERQLQQEKEAADKKIDEIEGR